MAGWPAHVPPLTTLCVREVASLLAQPRHVDALREVALLPPEIRTLVFDMLCEDQALANVHIALLSDACTHVRLEECPHVTSEALKEWADRCERVEKLTLIKAPCTASLPHVCARHRASLHTLHIDDCAADGHVLAEALGALCGDGAALRACHLISCPAPMGVLLQLGGQLEALTLRGCTGVDAGALSELLRRAPQLRTLDLSGCAEVGDEVVGEVASALGGGLEELKLVACDVSDFGVLQLAAQCARVHTLNLKGCSLVTTDAIVAVAWGMPCLRKLVLADCYRVGDDAIRALAAAACPLTSINLNWLEDVSDAALRELVVGLPTLERLSCKCHHDLSGATVRALADHCPQLRKLDLARCESVTEDALRYAAPRLCQLRRVNLDWIFAVRNDTLVDALVHWPHLTRLSVEGLALTDSAVCALAVHNERLEFLNVAGVNALTDSLLAELMAMRRPLRVINYYGERMAPGGGFAPMQ